MRLHLGCGTTRLDGWVNIDGWPIPGITDKVINLDSEALHLPFEADSVTEVYSSHFIEHLHHPLRLMQELHRVCKPGTLMQHRTPYGSSDDADEDPTHVRRMFVKSWGYFGQPYHWRSDAYGYQGDWQIRRIVLSIYPEIVQEVGGLDIEKISPLIMRDRNVVCEMIATLECIKPIRARDRGLQEMPEIRLAEAVLE